MTEDAVLIAGGGPTGLMLAAELALAGVEVAIVEPRLNHDLDGSRAGGLHARTLEVLDQRGVVERFLAAGQTHPQVGYAGLFLNIADFPTRHNYVLGLWQRLFEPLLAQWVAELGVPFVRGCSVDTFEQDATGIEVALSDGTRRRAGWLVGCDGGRSRVRKVAGIEFPGLDASTSWLTAEVELKDTPIYGFRHDAIGTHAIGPLPETGRVRVVLTEATTEHTGEPTLDTLRAALVGVYGTDFGLRHAHWVSRFTDQSRQAAAYRCGRVLLAGDAAHVHPPQGGQGLNTGVQDAVNLGWKLAQVVKGVSPASLLDTYHAERHPVGARVLHNTMAQVLLGKTDPRHQALRAAVVEMLAMDGPRKHTAAMISGLDIHYDLGPGHPLLGRRVPDLDLETAAGPTRVFALLHRARPVLLNLSHAGAFDLAPWADRVQWVQAHTTGPWVLPLIGEVPAPPAALVRPDGHVAWVGDLADPTLPEALTTWFGAPAST